MRKSSILRIGKDGVKAAAVFALAVFLVSGFIVAMIGGDVYYAASAQSYKVAGNKEDGYFVLGVSTLFFLLGLLAAVLYRAALRKEARRLWGSGKRAEAIRLWRELED